MQGSRMGMIGASTSEPENSGWSEKYLLWFYVIVTLAACAVYLSGSWSYPLEEQQDSGLQFRIIESLIESGSYSSYVGIYYYGLISIALKLFSFSGMIPEGNVVQAGVVIVNSFCLLGFLSGLYFLGRELFVKKTSIWLLIAGCSTLPVLQGQFRFVRSENFLLAVSIWALVAFFAYLRKPEKRGLLLACGILLALAITQKISGMVVAATVVVLYLAYLKSRIEVKTLGLLIVVTAVPTFCYWLAHYNYTGTWFFQSDVRHMGDTYSHTPEAEKFFRVNPIDAWQTPLRNEQRDSMLNIFLLDLYGDYWEYRYSLPEFAAQRISDGPENYSVYLKWRARVGLLLACLFVGLSISALLHFMLTDKLKRVGPLRQSLGWYGGIFLGVAYLVAAAFAQGYRPEDFNLVKWDYICWVLPFWLIPVCMIVDGGGSPRIRKITWGGCIFLMLGGLFQSIY